MKDYVLGAAMAGAGFFLCFVLYVVPDGMSIYDYLVAESKSERPKHIRYNTIGGEGSLGERIEQDELRARALRKQANDLLEKADLFEYENDTFHDPRCEPMREEAKKLLAEAKRIEKKLSDRGILCGWAGNTVYMRTVYSEETCAILGLERIEVK